MGFYLQDGNKHACHERHNQQARPTSSVACPAIAHPHVCQLGKLQHHPCPPFLAPPLDGQFTTSIDLLIDLLVSLEITVAPIHHNFRG